MKKAARHKPWRLFSGQKAKLTLAELLAAAR
jgi:hypothetical protein